MEIRTPQNEVEWNAYYDLRFRVLREPWQQARGSERSEADSFEIHLACFEENTILGVVRLDVLASDDFAQVRFMAVEANQQGKGTGKLLMHAAESYAKSLGFQKIMLQAREMAIPFYEKLGYKIIEKSHLLFGEIQHWRMEKVL